MIKVNNIKKSYDKGKNIVLNNINFSISEGEAVAIVGGNGAGKTTLLEIIAGINSPDSGDVIFVNSESNESSNNKKILEENVGFQFQTGSWPYNTRLSDLLKLFVGPKWYNEDYINQLLEIFEVKSILNERLNKCSGGEQQRANCMLSIIKKPKVLILDELITGLDLKMQIKITSFFKMLREKNHITLITVSHIPEEVEELADRIIVLKSGEIFLDTKIEDLLKKYKSVREYLIDFYKSETNFDIEVNYEDLL